ncbi:hypothetical protein GALL_521330 [mine drainage metagenome]|uniref:Uncharacterized protein n=1 Tax=mine drainage metagenome TaxID=410659 RepID=A0A1J5PFI6_9ZZZZ
MVDVAGFGHADHRVDQQVGLRLTRGAERQFLVGAVQRVARLERDDATPAELAEIGAQLVGRVAAAFEVIVHGLLDAGDRAAKVNLACGVVQVVHRRMGDVIGTKHFVRLKILVGHPFVADRQDGKDDAFGIAQRDVLTRLDAFGECLGHIKGDRHWPDLARGEVHVIDDRVVVRLGQETLQRVEATVHQKLKVADLT